MKQLFTTILLLLCISCDSDSSGNNSSENEQLKSGFDKFKKGNYFDAITEFEKKLIEFDSIPKVKAEVLVGLGFSRMRSADGDLSTLTTSLQNFKDAYFADNNNIDARAGLCLVAPIAEKNYSYSVTHGEALLAQDASYKFAHDSSLNYKDIQLQVAMSYFNSKNFTKCYEMIKKVNSSFSTSTSAADFVHQLSIELERLVQKHN